MGACILRSTLTFLLAEVFCLPPPLTSLEMHTHQASMSSGWGKHFLHPWRDQYQEGLLGGIYLLCTPTLQQWALGPLGLSHMPHWFQAHEEHPFSAEKGFGLAVPMPCSRIVAIACSRLQGECFPGCFFFFIEMTQAGLRLLLTEHLMLGTWPDEHSLLE